MTREKAILVEEVTNLPLAVDLGNGTAALRIVGTIADGANSILGSKTDAKSPATDATPISEMQVLKQISASVQSQALDQPKYIDSYFTITRPANITPYSDGDAILDTVGIAMQKFAGVAKSAGRGIDFINLLAFTNDTGLTGKTINVVFYKESPVNPVADNTAFSYTSANELIRKGTVQLTFGTGTLASVAQLGIDSNGSLNLALCPTATDIYVQAWLPIGYTPSANSTYILLKASVIQN